MSERELRETLQELLRDAETAVEDLTGEKPVDVLCGCVGASEDVPFPPPCAYHKAKMLLERVDDRDLPQDRLPTRRSILDL